MEVGVLGGKPAFGFEEEIALHQIADGFGHEGVAGERRRKIGAAVDRRRRGRGEGVECAGLAQLVFSAAVTPVDARVGPDGERRLVGRDLKVHPIKRQPPIQAADEMGRNEIAPQLIAVRVIEPPAEIVLGQPPLPDAGHRLAAPLTAGIHAPPPDITGVVEPVVPAPEQPVGAGLDVRDGAEIIVEGDFFVHDAVAIAIAGHPEVGRIADQHLVAHEADRPRGVQVVRIDGALVHFPVAIRVFQHDHAARRRLGGRLGFIQIDRQMLDDFRDVVGGEFGDPQPATRIEGHHHRVLHERLGGDQFDAKMRRQDKGLAGLRGGQDRGGGDFNLRARRPLGIGADIADLRAARQGGQHGGGECCKTKPVRTAGQIHGKRGVEGRGG